jgi:hypothetical protein
MTRSTGLLAAFLALPLVAGCVVTPEQEASMQWNALSADLNRAYAYSYQDFPFTNSATVSVIATEHGELRTYALAPCRGGTTVCAGSPNGRAGRVEQTLDHVIVTGLYGATFFLSPGGDGGLRRPGHPDVFLAWEYAE